MHSAVLQLGQSSRANGLLSLFQSNLDSRYTSPQARRGISTIIYDRRRPRAHEHPSPPSPFNTQTPSGSSSPPASKVNKPPRLYNDHVDSLDVSDPNGTRWHHASPYELPRAAGTRPRSQFVGPGVGTFAGPIEGSEPVEAVCHAYFCSSRI